MESVIKRTTDHLTQANDGAKMSLEEKYQGIVWRKHLPDIPAFEPTRLVGLGETQVKDCPAHEEKWYTENPDSFLSADFFSDARDTSVPVVLIVADDGSYFDSK